MIGRLHSRAGLILGLYAGLLSAGAVRADAISAVQSLRSGGCGGTVPAASPLYRRASLDRAAEKWAAGGSPAAAAGGSGYPAEAVAGIHISGAESSVASLLKRSRCGALTDPKMHDIGAYHRGADTWIVLAAPYVVPDRSQTEVLALRVLQLVNQARASGARCGTRAFVPVPPVTLSGTLEQVAFEHSLDMAQHNYFEHEDRAGRSPAARVRASGYSENVVGENIAYGPKTAEEVVQGWLDSPGHCENIMDARFAEMGVAYAAGRAPRRGVYWVQLLAAPRLRRSPAS